MSRFAENTTVDPERSRQELIHTLERYGATSFVEGRQSTPNRYAVTFQLLGRWYRFSLAEKPVASFYREQDQRSPKYWPSLEAMHAYPSRYERYWADLLKRQKQEWKRQWRVLINHVKMLMDMAFDDQEADVAGSQAQDILLPFLLLPTGTTFAEHYAPQIDLLYASGEQPEPLLRLLPTPKEYQ